MLKDGKELHWQLIELIAYWQGKVNATHLINHFSISRKHAGDYLRAYQERYPLNLDYSQSAQVIQNRTLSQSQARPFFATLVGTQFRDEGMCWHYNKVKHTSAIDQKQRYSINWLNATTQILS
jgi:hypothetical protein